MSIPPYTGASQSLIRPKISLGRKFATILVPLLVIPVALMGGATYFRSRAMLRNQALTQIETATQSQAQYLLDWTDDRNQWLFLGLTPELKKATAEMMLSPNPETRDLLLDMLDNLKYHKGALIFSDLILAHLDGEQITILVSTQPEWENSPPRFLAQIPTNSLTSIPVLDDPAISPDSMAFVTSAPQRAVSDAQTDSLLIAISSSISVGQLMLDIQAFWEVHDTYRLELGNTFLTFPPDTSVIFERYAIVPAIQTGTEHPIFVDLPPGETGNLQYTDSDGQAILSAYQLIPKWDMAVVTDLPQDIILSGLEQLEPFMIALILITAVITTIVILLATNRMLIPLRNLTRFAGQIAEGNLNQRLPEDRDDELGVLSITFNHMAANLSELYQSLEAQVAERTQQMRTASEIARAVTSSPSLDDLLRRAVDLIGDRFGYEYVSIFLIDREGKSAILRESRGEVGQALKARGYQIAVGSDSIIGWTSANNQSRIASNVAQDPLHLKHELLPDTRSEAALPLQTGDLVLGVLDVQSTKQDAFRTEDVEILQTLADELSAAIYNARLAQSSVSVAEHARLVSKVTAQLSGVLEIDEVLETAARSLHDALGQPDIIVKLVPPAGEEQLEKIASSSSPEDQARSDHGEQA